MDGRTAEQGDTAAHGPVAAGDPARLWLPHRHATLRGFHDATRALNDPAAILRAMSQLLADQFGTSHLLYFEVSDHGTRLAVHDSRDRVVLDPSVHAQLKQAFEALADQPDASATRVIENECGASDAADDPVTRIAALTMACALLNIPIVKDERRVASIMVLDARPRRWTDDEIALCEELAEALWAAIARARAEAAIAEREQQFRTLAQNIPALCWLGDQEGRAYWANPQWQDYFGSPEANGGDMSAFVHPDDHARAEAAWVNASATGTPIEMTVSLRGRDGHYRAFRASSVPIRDASGRISGWCGTLVDLSEREAHSRRQSFLRAFYDATRAMTRASDILAALGEMMIAYMGVGQVTYSEVSDHDPSGFDVFLARPGRRFDEVPRLFRFAEGFEALLECYRHGRTLVAYDYEDELPELTGPVVTARRAVEMCASITVPLVKEGRLVAMLSAVDPVPRRWTRDEVELVEELAERVWAVVSRARAEAALQERERSQAFLVGWGDRVRGLTGSDAVMDATLSMLGEHLGVTRATYAQGDAAGQAFTICGEWIDGVAPLAGTTFTMDSVGPELRREWLAGQTLRYDDVANDGRIAPDLRPAYAATDVGAFVSVPLIENGRVRASLSVQHHHSRVWRESEVQLLRDIAERTWVVLERTRAEAELKQRERHQAFLIDWADDIRDETRPEAIVAATLAKLGPHFGVTRATYSEGDETGRRISNRGEWLRGVASIADTVFDLDEVGESVAAAWVGGAPIQYDDVTTDPRIPDARRPYFAGADVRSLLTVPLIEAGLVRCALSLQSKAQRDWQPGEVALVRDLTERVWVAVERARAQAELQQREADQAFLIDWSDRLRGETTPQSIVATTLESLGRHLGVTRATFAERDGAMFCVTEEWRDGVPSLRGNRFALVNVGAAVDRQWNAGEVIRYDDTGRDRRLEPAAAQRYRDNAIAAFVSVPLVEGGQMQSALSFQHALPRVWRDSEIQLIRDVAERTWVAMTRAQAQIDLQERERTQAFLVAWNDAVREERSARTILAQTVDMLAGHLGAARVNYAEPNHDFSTMTVIEEYNGGSILSVRGATYRVADFGERLAARQRSGDPVRINDIATDPLLDDASRPLFDGIGVRAALTLPMLRGNEIVAVLSVQHDTPRRWTDAEVGLVRDLADRTLAVLERAQSEARLAESEAQLSAFMDNAPVAMNLRDHKGRYVRVNAEFGRATGRSIDEITGLTPRDIFPAPIARQIEEADARAMRGEVVSLELTQGLDRKYGSVLTIAFPIGDGSGAAKIAGFTIDLTERRQAEAALAKSRDTLYQAEKLTALGSLLAGVSHELNNPLSIVVAQAVMMERQSQGLPLAERAQKIRKAADRCARIVQSFLAMARQKRPEREAVDLNAVISAAHELADFGLRNDAVTTVRALAPGLPPILADSDQLHQIVINLIVNAQQAMAGGGGPDRTLTLRSSLGETPGTVVLDVADSGPGIPPEISRRIFEPFYTTKPQGQGTGVGLSFSQGLAEAHGGTLEVVPVAHGACFRLTLPIGDADAVMPGEHATATPSPAAPRRALVIDDEHDIAEALADFLSLDGFDCELAIGGNAAKTLLADGDYDLIVSDLRMPGIDGPQLHAWLMVERPDLADKIAFATGDTLGHAAARFLSDLARPVLEKPFTPEAVHRLLEQLDLA